MGVTVMNDNNYTTAKTFKRNCFHFGYQDTSSKERMLQQKPKLGKNTRGVTVRSPHSNSLCSNRAQRAC